MFLLKWGLSQCKTYVLGNTKPNTNLLRHSVINAHAIFYSFIPDISYCGFKLLNDAAVVISIKLQHDSVISRFFTSPINFVKLFYVFEDSFSVQKLKLKNVYNIEDNIKTFAS